MGSAVAHRLFRVGLQVLISDRAQSPHARRGMAFTDALFEGSATLEGVTAQCAGDLEASPRAGTQADAVPIVTLPESLLLAAMRSTPSSTRRCGVIGFRADLRTLARLSIGIGPGLRGRQTTAMSRSKRNGVTPWGRCCTTHRLPSEPADRTRWLA